jgi:hypothetical protein
MSRFGSVRRQPGQIVRVTQETLCLPLPRSRGGTESADALVVVM